MQKQDGEIIWIRNESEGNARSSHSLTYSPLDKELNLFLRDDRSWKFMYREQRRRPTPVKEVFARVDTGRRQMEGRITPPAGWWGKCDCELSVLCKWDKWAIYAPTGFLHIDTMLCLRIWIDVSTTTTVQGVWVIVIRPHLLFCVFCQGTSSQPTLYKLWWMLPQFNLFKLIHRVAIDGWPDRENTGAENIIITYQRCSVWAL